MTGSVRVANKGLSGPLFSTSCEVLVRVANKGLMGGGPVRVAGKGLTGWRELRRAGFREVMGYYSNAIGVVKYYFDKSFGMGQLRIGGWRLKFRVARGGDPLLSLE